MAMVSHRQADRRFQSQLCVHLLPALLLSLILEVHGPNYRRAQVLAVLHLSRSMRSWTARSVNLGSNTVPGASSQACQASQKGI